MHISSYDKRPFDQIAIARKQLQSFRLAESGQSRGKSQRLVIYARCIEELAHLTALRL